MIHRIDLRAAAGSIPDREAVGAEFGRIRRSGALGVDLVGRGGEVGRELADRMGFGVDQVEAAGSCSLAQLAGEHPGGPVDSDQIFDIADATDVLGFPVRAAVCLGLDRRQ